MKKTQKTALFAFKLAEKKQQKNTEKTLWKAKSGVATAGCTGPDARANDYDWGADNGIWC